MGYFTAICSLTIAILLAVLLGVQGICYEIKLSRVREEKRELRRKLAAASSEGCAGMSDAEIRAIEREKAFTVRESDLLSAVKSAELSRDIWKKGGCRK